MDAREPALNDSPRSLSRTNSFCSSTRLIYSQPITSDEYRPISTITVLPPSQPLPDLTAPTGSLISPVVPGENSQTHCGIPSSHQEALNTNIRASIPMAVPDMQYRVETAALPSPAPSGCSGRSPVAILDASAEEVQNGAFRSSIQSPVQVRASLRNEPQIGERTATLRAEGSVATIQVSEGERSHTAMAPQNPSNAPIRDTMSSTPPLRSPLTLGSSVQVPSFNVKFWERARQILQTITAQSGRTLSDLVEKPRLSLLQTACSAEDGFYLILHQVFCLQTVAPLQYAKLPGFGPSFPSQTPGWEILKRLLVDNRRLSGPFLTWCSRFPAPLEVENPNQYGAMMQQLSASMATFSEYWTRLEDSVKSRNYPPLVEELVDAFQAWSPTLFKVAFTALGRAIYGQSYAQFEPRLQALYHLDSNDFSDRVKGDKPDDPNERRRLVNQLISSYRSLHKASVRANNPPRATTTFTGQAAMNPGQRVPDGPAITPSVNQVGQVTMQAGTRPNVSNSVNAPYQTVQALNSSIPNSPVPALPNSGNLPYQTLQAPSPLVPAPIAAMQNMPAVQPTQIPSSRVHSPPYPGYTIMGSSAPAATYTASYQSPLISTSNVSYPPMSAPSLPSQEVLAQQARMVTPGRVPTRDRSHQAVTENQSMTIGLNTAVVPGAHNAIAFAQNDVRHSVTSPRGVNSAISVNSVKLLPPPNYVPPISSRPNPLRVALHQAHLRSPIRRIIRPGPSGDEETELFQYFKDFALEPALLGTTACTHRWKFQLSGKEFERLPRRITRAVGERSIKVLHEGCQIYRLRCIRVFDSAPGINRSAWSIAETVWPSVLYIFVNGSEQFVRRKLHNGKDLPLDITDSLQNGENEISVHLLRGPAEREMVYGVAIEVLDISSINQVKQLVQTLPSTASRDEVRRRLTRGGDDDDLAVMDDYLTIDLKDPFIAQVFKLPVRGINCSHMECFDLDTFLVTKACKSGKGTMKDDWRCPICRQDARPQSLIMDEFLLELRSKLQLTNRLEGATAITIKADGSWRLKTENDPPPSTSAGGASVFPSRRNRSTTRPSVRSASRAEHVAVSGPVPNRSSTSSTLVELD